MSNKVSFVFVARDKWLKVANKIDASTVNLRRKFRKLGKQLKSTSAISSTTSESMSRDFKRMAAAALSFFGLRAFITKGAEFQDSLADLSAITGATGKDLARLQDDMFSMGKTAATSASSVSEAFKLVASAKPDLLKNLDALKSTTAQVLLLKNAAGIELAEAANITAQGLNIFGASADQANRFVNVLAAGAKLGSSEIRDTGEAMLIAGPAARAAGLNFESLNAAIQTVAVGGIKGARAGTALNAILGRLRRAGIDFEKIGLQGAFETIGKKLNSVTDSTKRAQLEATLFGEEHSKVGLALVTNFKKLGEYEKSLKGTNIAQEQAAIRLGTFNAKMRRFGTILGEKVIRLFTRLEPMITKQAESWGKFIDNLGTEEINSIADSIKGLLTVLGVLLDVGRAIAAIFKGVGTAIGEGAAQMATFNYSVGTGFKDAFSIGGKFLGLFGDDEPLTKKTGSLGAGAVNKTDVNVNLKAPANTIESIKSRTTGKPNGLNVGVNMATAQ